MQVARLSPSIAKLLLVSPAKAYLHHRLLGGKETATTDAMTTGKLLERFICGHGLDDIDQIDAPDFRTKEARILRDASIAAGRIPCIAEKYEQMAAVGGAIRTKVEMQIGTLNVWQFQPRFEWTDGTQNYSAVLDGLHIDEAAGKYYIYDLKVTQSLSKHDLERTVSRYGYDLQAAAYIEAVEAAYPLLVGRGEFRFIFYQATEPYCVTIATLDGSYKLVGNGRWEKAKALWNACMTSGEWPDANYKETDLTSDGCLRLTPKNYELDDIAETDLDSIF